MPAPRVGRPVPNELASALVFDRGGVSRVLEEAWARSPALIVFLRHFGCIGCSEQVADLSPRLHELGDAGVNVILVGNGPPPMIDEFLSRKNLSDRKVTVLTDPTLATHRAASLDRSWWKTFGPRAIVDFVRALFAGHAPHAREGDLYQQGGSLLVDVGGEVVYFRASESLGDHSRSSDLVEAALALLVKHSAVRV